MTSFLTPLTLERLLQFFLFFHLYCSAFPCNPSAPVIHLWPLPWFNTTSARSRAGGEVMNIHPENLLPDTELWREKGKNSCKESCTALLTEELCCRILWACRSCWDLTHSGSDCPWQKGPRSPSLLSPFLACASADQWVRAICCKHFLVI